MKVVDLSHVMNVHTPGWVGYAGNKMYYAQNLQTQMIVAQRIDTALHVGTHFDGAMHATDNRKGDMASLPLDYLVNRGVVVDISKHMHDWAVITPQMIESAGLPPDRPADRSAARLSCSWMIFAQEFRIRLHRSAHPTKLQAHDQNTTPICARTRRAP